MDITLHWDIANSRGDIAFQYGDVVTGSDLATSVLVSLFSDRLATQDDTLPDGTGDRRGWWGDSPDATVPLIGSRLWLLDRAKETQAVLQAARDYEQESLTWLTDQNIAANVDVYCEWSRPGMLGSLITITKPSGQRQTLAFDWAWQQLTA